MRTIIISAFPGMGKSYAVEHLPQYKMLDLESSNYSWIKTNDGKVRNPLFAQNYIDHLKQLKDQGLYQVVFVSSHKIVRQALQHHKIYYYLVYPDISLKDQYIRRYRERGNEQEFVELLEQKWEQWINQIQHDQDNKYCYKNKVLESDFYLTKLFRDERI